MIYLAILLVLCGLLILITALSVESGIVDSDGVFISRVRKKTANPAADTLKSEDVEIIFPGDDFEKLDIDIDNETFHSFEDEERDNIIIDDSDRLSGDEEPVRVERRKLDSTGRPEIIEKREKKENSLLFQPENQGQVSAVMYDDRSNIIDYESGSAAIDSTLSKYQNIKRIGKGTIESDYDGVSFFLDEKLYRFDFHKVYDIWSGSNYVALPLKGNSTVKLFIIENSAGFPGKVESNFKEYEKGL